MPDASRRLVAVMMGEPKEHNRVQDSLKMLNYGYTAYDAVRLYKANQVIESPRIYKGAENTVKAGVDDRPVRHRAEGHGREGEAVGHA